jgi:hypothetical protein
LSDVTEEAALYRVVQCQALLLLLLPW